MHCHSENGNGNVTCNAKSVAFSKRYLVTLTLSSITTKRISCIFTVMLQCIVICLALEHNVFLRVSVNSKHILSVRYRARYSDVDFICSISSIFIHYSLCVRCRADMSDNLERTNSKIANSTLQFILKKRGIMQVSCREGSYLWNRCMRIHNDTNCWWSASFSLKSS